MTCRYCGTRNGDDEHRCTRCGRRPGDTLTVSTPVMTGALATKLEPVARREDQAPKTRRAPNFSRAIQTELFATRPEGNVVSIARYTPRAEPKPRAKAESGTRAGTGKSPVRKRV